MRIEGGTALSWRRGRYLPLKTLKGPRPSPLDFGLASATAADFDTGERYWRDFRGRPRLHVFHDAYLVMGHGDDGAVLTSNREIVWELCAFAQLGHRERPFDLEAPEHPEVLDNVVVGVDGASRNYYHWLVNALARARLCAPFAGPDAVIALPDFRAAGDGEGQVRGDVLQASMDAMLGDRPRRLLAPGVHRVKTLSALWTLPTAPTDIAGVEGLYTVFDETAAMVTERPARRPRHLYFSRRGAHDRRIPQGDVAGLEAVLARHGFESLVLEDMSFEAQVRAAAEARVIVTPHGAGMTNLLFSHRDAVVIELVSHIGEERSFRPWYYELATGRGQRYGAIKVGDPDWLPALDAALRRCLR